MVDKVRRDIPDNDSTKVDNALNQLSRQEILITDVIRQAISAHSYPEVLANALIKLNKEGLMTDANREALSKFYSPEDLANALIKLNKEGLMTDANREALSKFYSPEDLANALIKLNKEGLMTDDNRKKISEHRDPNAIADLLLFMNADDLFIGGNIWSNRYKVENHEDPASLYLALVLLRDAKLLTQDNFNEVVAHKNLRRCAYALYEFYTKKLLTQDNFRVVVATEEAESRARVHAYKVICAYVEKINEFDITFAQLPTIQLIQNRKEELLQQLKVIIQEQDLVDAKNVLNIKGDVLKIRMTIEAKIKAINIEAQQQCQLLQERQKEEEMQRLADELFGQKTCDIPNTDEPIGKMDIQVEQNTPTEFTQAPYYDITRKEEQSPSMEKEGSPLLSNISMMVLGGFITAVGIAAVAVAFTVLNAATLGIPGVVVASVGIAAALVGVGLFATGVYRNSNKPKNEPTNSEELLIDSIVASTGPIK